MKKGFKKALSWSLAVSAAITFISWLFLGTNSPLNHGISPDLHDMPFIAPFVIVKLPAGIICVNLFGKHGTELTYFALILLQWLPLGALLSSVFSRKEN